MQSSFWAEFKALEGFKVERLAWKDSGAALLLHYPSDSQPGFVLCPEGPVLDWSDIAESRAALRALIDHVKQMPNAIGLRIDPHLPRPAPSLLRNWSKSPIDLTPADTNVVDISQSEDQVLAKAHPKCRYNLRVADRYGVAVTATTDIAEAHRFYEILLDTSNRTGFYIEPFGYFLNLLEVLFRSGTGEILFATFEGKTLATILVVAFGKRATYFYGGSLDESRNVMPVFPLHREAMRRARDRGCTEYDFYGVDAFERRDHLYAGITRFKKQWGGQMLQRIGSRDLVFYDLLADQIIKDYGRLEAPSD